MRSAVRRFALAAFVPVLAAAQSPVFTPAGGLPARASGGMVIADFNLDGAQDIATLERETGLLTVWFGSFEGIFTAPPGGAQQVGGAPGSLAAGDFNNDGLLDLVAADEGQIFLGQPQSPRILVLLGNGTGRFTRGPVLPRLPVESGFELTVADFNRDGNLDVIAANPVRVLYFPGSPSGELRTPVEVPLGGCHYGFVTGEFTNDTFPDLAFLPDGSGFNAPVILRGNGSGGFIPSAPLEPGSCGYTRLAVGDFNRDGFADLFVPRQNRYTLYFGSIATVFSDRVLTFLSARAGIPATGDFNGDGNPDIVSQWSDTVLSSFGPAYAVLDSSPSPQVGPLSAQVAVGDIDADGRPDLVVAGLSSVALLKTSAGEAPAPVPQTITFAPLADRALNQSPFTLTASASSLLTVKYTSLTPEVCTITNQRDVTLRAVGQCVIVANQPGDWTYAAAPAVQRAFQVKVTLLAQTINFAQIPAKVLGDPPFAISATATSGLPVTVVSVTPSVCAISGTTVTLLGLGECTLVASQPGNATYAPAASVQRSFAVLPFAPLTPSIAGLTNAASYSGGIVARGSYVAIFGTQLQYSPVVTLRDSAGVQHTLDAIFVSATQINLLMPGNAQLGAGTLRVTTIHGSAEAPVTVAGTAPGLFSADGTGQGLAAAQVLIVNADKSVTTRLVTDGPVPLLPGTEVYLVLYGTGIRFFAVSREAFVAGQSVEILYAGAQGTFPGLDQVNLRIPLNLGVTGPLNITVMFDGVVSNTVRATFQ